MRPGMVLALGLASSLALLGASAPDLAAAPQASAQTRGHLSAAPSTAASASPTATTFPADPIAALISTAHPAGSATVPASASPGPSACQEHVPEGKARPAMSENFPAKGTTGHVSLLKIVVRHGKGERVLADNIEVQTASDSAKTVRGAGFIFPNAKGPATPTVMRNPIDTDGTVETTVRIPVVPLPKEGGRQELTLPPMPVALARASGEVITLCTQAHTLTVEDATANQPTALPKPNPEPQSQRELWVALRNLAYGSLIGLALAAIALLLFRLWQKRERKLPPPPPPRPAWEIALEALKAIAGARLVEQGQLAEHFDRVSHTLKEYLGNRFGFDGLESTSAEVLETLQQHPEGDQVLEETRRFLEQTDLVKFAKVEPTEAQCRGLWSRAEELVRNSTPMSSRQSPEVAES